MDGVSHRLSLERFSESAPSVVASGEVARGQRAPDAPPWSDRGQRLEDEAALFQLGVRNHQSARSEPAAAPQDDVEIEHTRAPAPAGPAAEFTLDAFELGEHLGRTEAAFDQRNRVREVAAGSAARRIEDDRRGIEEVEFFVQPNDRGLDHGPWKAVAAVRPVGADRDRVKKGPVSYGSPLDPAVAL